MVLQPVMYTAGMGLFYCPKDLSSRDQNVFKSFEAHIRVKNMCRDCLIRKSRRIFRHEKCVPEDLNTFWSRERKSFGRKYNPLPRLVTSLT